MLSSRDLRHRAASLICMALPLCLSGGCTTPPVSEPAHSAARLTAGDGPYGEQVLYLNFDGASITRIAQGTPDDARTNQSAVPDQWPLGTAHTTAAFDAAAFAPIFTPQAARDRITLQVASWFGDFNVQVVTARPAGGRYTMILVGGLVDEVLGGSSGAIGLAPLDCNNGSQVDVGYVFSSTITTPAPQTAPQIDAALTYVAVIAAHSAATAFGLENVDNSMDLMSGALSVTSNAFLDTPSPYFLSSSYCVPGNTTQNSHALLLTNLGPAPSRPSTDLSAPPSLDFAGSSADLGSGGSLTGVPCASAAQCGPGGICLTSSGRDYCTKVCQPQVANACPSGYSCDPVEGTHYCVVSPTGGCSLSPGRAAPATGALYLLGLGLVSALASARRRARRA